MEHPKPVVIPNDIPAFSRLMGMDNHSSYGADVILIDRYIGILRNSEGALLDLKGNRKINGEIIAGTFLVISFDEHGFITSLSDENIKKYSAKFWNIEKFTDKEVRASFWTKFEEEINSLETEFNSIL